LAVLIIGLFSVLTRQTQTLKFAPIFNAKTAPC